MNKPHSLQYVPVKLLFLVKAMTSTARSVRPDFLTTNSIRRSGSSSIRSTNSGDTVMFTTIGQEGRQILHSSSHYMYTVQNLYKKLAANEVNPGEMCQRTGRPHTHSFAS